MTTTPLMSLVLPTDHDSNDIWDTILDTVFGLIDGHDHTTGKGAKVPAAGLKINADVSWSDAGVSRSITDLVAIDFKPSPSSAVTGLAGAFFISDGTGGLTVNELYYRTILGTNVQFTLGAALNVAAFGGGIGGDYISASALLSYDAATLSYWLQQPGAPRPWARIRVGDVDIYETAASIVNRVRLKSPAALAASYDVTWPAAVPGSTSLVQMSSAGVLTSSNTVANAVTLSATLTAAAVNPTTITASGLVTANAGVTVATGQAVTLSGTATLTAGGLITASAGLTAGANQNVTVSGTGTLKHGVKTIHRTPHTYDAIQISGTILNVGTVKGVQLSTSTSALIRLPELSTHERLLDLNVKFSAAGDRTGTTVQVVKYGSGDPATITTTNVGSALTNSGTAQMSVTALNATPASGESYWLSVITTAAPATVISFVLTYDVP